VRKGNKKKKKKKKKNHRKKSRKIPWNRKKKIISSFSIFSFSFSFHEQHNQWSTTSKSCQQVTGGVTIREANETQ